MFSSKHNRIELYIHLIWATWDRLPLISPEFERSLHRLIGSEVDKNNCALLAVGGVENHVHTLVEIPSTLAVADLVKQLKGVSSQFVNAHWRPEPPFKWQGAYGAFSVSRWDVSNIRDYIHHQREHHANNTFKPQLEGPLLFLDDEQWSGGS